MLSNLLHLRYLVETQSILPSQTALFFKSSCIKVTFGNLRTFPMEKMVNFISNSTCTSFYNDCPNLQIWQASSLIFQGRLLLKAGPLSYP